MAITLNKQAVANARRLIKAGKVVRDERDDWSEHALAAGAETAWVKTHGWNSYAKWHFGVDDAETPETKGRFSFPFGDYSKVHRCAVISLESRAAQFDHTEIAAAAKKLLDVIDAPEKKAKMAKKSSIKKAKSKVKKLKSKLKKAKKRAKAG